MIKASKDGSSNITDESVNTATHMAGAIFAIFGAGLLIAQSAIVHKWWHLGSFIFYGFGLIGLFVASTLHHGINGSETTNKWLRNLDYVAIYILILGTITPICLVLSRDVAGYAVLGTVFLTAAFGMVMQLIFHNLPNYFSLTLYLCLGWLPALLPVFTDINLSIGAFAWLVAGGLFYSVGSIIYGAEKPNPIPGKLGFHEIWHIAVLLGALCHYVFLYKFILYVD